MNPGTVGGNDETQTTAGPTARRLASTSRHPERNVPEFVVLVFHRSTRRIAPILLRSAGRSSLVAKGRVILPGGAVGCATLPLAPSPSAIPFGVKLSKSPDA